MKSFVLALAASSVLFAVPALAGDGFAGFNVGVHGGYNFANDQFEAPGTDFSGSGDGFIGGLHGGYTASLGERMQLGAEAEVDWAETKSKVEAGGTTVEINQGLGGYLQTAGVRHERGGWTIGGRALDPAGRYSVAIADFLLTGGEVNLGFLTTSNPQVRDVREGRDIRRVLIESLRAAYPQAAPR